MTVNLAGAAGSSTPIKVNNDVANRIIAGISTTVPSVGLAGTISVLNMGSNFTIGGTLVTSPYCGSQDVEMVTVNLSGAPSIPASPISNAAGSYSFDVPQGSSPTVMPVKNTGWFNGVDIFDVLLVNQHFLGIPPLIPSPYQILAADANNNNAIDIADVFAINQLSLNNLPNGLGTSWEFVDAAHVFANPMNPWTAPVPSSITLNNVQANDLTLDFIGYKIGDVDCSGDPTLFAGNAGDDRSGNLPFAISDLSLQAGQEFVVNFKAKDFADLIGYQTTVSFDPHVIQFMEFIPTGNLVNLTGANVNPHHAAEGLLATNWFNIEPVDLEDGESIFALKFKALQPGVLSEILDANSNMIQAKAVKADGSVLGIDLVFESVTDASEVEGGTFALYQNQPNPFGFKTAIGFTLPEFTKATLTITDAAGRVLKVVEGNFSAGYHQVFVDRSELAAKGILFYKLETPTNTAVRKMILMD